MIEAEAVNAGWRACYSATLISGGIRHWEVPRTPGQSVQGGSVIDRTESITGRPCTEAFASAS